ncbi:AtpZ/AtpI family protein [Nocardioides sp. GY 10113]|uniref:AtpZ/AtpI family protein n=1 Tax=Nocardioides sp. GY 10113 TaxID=2569761 RepID=UPI0010A77D7B|nr:AtpZ/AtpI family protein [Nocardioides sp. GY 10113]TIC88771.1 AtpZ/AtpI family protein [Nocardioides sp. GY 10113]
MSQPQESPKGDPWHAFGYIVAGVAFYGFLGWLADRWLGTHLLVAVGILIGAGLGIYMTAQRFKIEEPGTPPAHPTDTHSQDTE